MSLSAVPTGQACGAFVSGVDLSSELSAETVAEIRKLWLEHHVLVFADQAMTDEDLERFTLHFGPFGHDPFFESIPGHEHIAAIQRDADETTSIFAETWHTDWSFQKNPPIGTCLLGITIPEVGGDTLYANQHLAYEKMPAALRARFEGKTAIHSARMGYSKDGIHGDEEKEAGRPRLADPGRVPLPPPVEAWDARDVGQPKRPAPRNGWVRGTRPPASSHHDRCCDLSRP